MATAFLRTHRKRAGLTLEALATETGLTKSYLSKVERGISTPSIAVAIKIANALGSDVGRLFSDQHDDAAFTIDRHVDNVGDLTEQAAYRPIAPGMVRKSMQPFVVHPAIDDDETAFKEHPGDELVVVLSGSIEVSIPNHVWILETGDSLYFDANTPHRMRSISPDRARALVVVNDTMESDGGSPSSRCGH